MLTEEEKKKKQIFQKIEKFFWGRKNQWEETISILRIAEGLRSVAANKGSKTVTPEILKKAPFHVTYNIQEIQENGFSTSCKAVVLLDVSHPYVIEFIEQKFKEYGKIEVGYCFKSKFHPMTYKEKSIRISNDAKIRIIRALSKKLSMKFCIEYDIMKKILEEEFKEICTPKI